MIYLVDDMHTSRIARLSVYATEILVQNAGVSISLQTCYVNLARPRQKAGSEITSPKRKSSAQSLAHKTHCSLRVRVTSAGLRPTSANCTRGISTGTVTTIQPYVPKISYYLQVAIDVGGAAIFMDFLIARDPLTPYLASCHQLFHFVEIKSLLL